MAKNQYLVIRSHHDTREIAELNQPRRLRILGGQTGQGCVDIQQIVGLIDENPPHRFGCGGKEMPSAMRYATAELASAERYLLTRTVSNDCLATGGFIPP